MIARRPKVIFFDFDGVVVESTHLKTEAFGCVFAPWPEAIEPMLEFHKENMGLSRYVKFRHFYEEVLGEAYTDEKGEALARSFSEIVLDMVIAAPEVPGARHCLEQIHADIACFVASGTPEDELRHIVQARELEKYFRGVFGSPVLKADIVRNCLAEVAVPPEDALFVGDAGSDMRAAKESGVQFILRCTDENVDLRRNAEPDEITAQVSDMHELAQLIGDVK